MKKILSLVCALALLVSLMPLCVASAEEPIEITYYRPELNRNSVAYYNDTAWVQEIEKRLNIKLTIKGVPEADYTTAVNALLTSGDYPDLLYYDWNQYSGGAQAGIEDGVIVPVGQIPEYKEKVPNWFNVVEGNANVRRAVALDDGSVVTFCHWEPNMARSAYWGYAIRKDWLDRLGLEVPTTVDEMYNVLKAFKEQDANGNGDPNDEIPFSSCNWWGTAHPGLDTLAAAWSLKINFLYSNPQEPGKVTFATAYNDGANFKDYVTTMAKWYAEGLIDAEYASQTHDSMDAKINQDKVGSFFCFPDNVAGYEASIGQTLTDAGYADPAGVMVYGLVPLKGIDGVAYTYDYDNAMVSYAGNNQPTVITTAAVKNGHIDKCLELLNFMYSEEGSEIINWGVEGVSYTKDENGNNVWTEAVTADPEYGPADAVFKYALPTMGSFPKAMSYEAWASMNLTVPDQIITHKNYAACDTSLDLPNFALSYDEQEAYNTVFTDATTAVAESMVKIITGQEPVEKIDDLLKTVNEVIGIQQAIDAYQSAYDRYLAH